MRGHETHAMRIMHLSRAAETLRWFLIPAMNAQRARGHEVCICTGDGPDADALRAAGFEVFSHGMKRRDRKSVV